ncbi:hypothetical protein SAMN05444374_11661 [Rhodococcoides kroppenstedtii]|uniref:Uncharacterized protein n=1 Tax=Rhodococcoides kroppenstedtii TaxID=293050 RepID=A0A1I0UA16_9NOCA|nr:hypothetical protein [Rhodococcus kroppenstedtii]SFA60908.1 hypothetical protein SAMN05444374_11661 [Rhodococcus kroppenstedtii]
MPAQEMSGITDVEGNPLPVGFCPLHPHERDGDRWEEACRQCMADFGRPWWWVW